MTKQQLPHRALLWPHKVAGHYDLVELRRIANKYQINLQRKRFYRSCDHLAMQYYMDLMNEIDYYALSGVKATYRSALADGRKYAKSLEATYAVISVYSWYREVNFENDDEVNAKELHEWVIDTNKSLEDAIKRLPKSPKGRRSRLALRRWANAHMDFWKKNISGRISTPNGPEDGMPKCHQFLHDLLEPIDPDAVKGLRTIVRKRRAAEKARTKRASS